MSRATPVKRIYEDIEKAIEAAHYDAALIAAAPELRDALRGMLETFDCSCASPETCDHDVLKRAWNALGKAGE